MTSEELMDKLIGGHIKGRAKKGYCSMGGFKAVLTFDDSWDADSVRNTLADYDHVPGVTVSASSECNEVARQSKGSAEQQTDNSESKPCSMYPCSGVVSQGCFDVTRRPCFQTK